MSYQDCDPQTASELTQTNGVGFTKDKPSWKLYAGLSAVLLFVVGIEFAGIKAQSSPPSFTDAERARIFKAQSAYNALAPQWQKVSADMEAVQRMAKDRCGTEYHPDVDKDGEPVCLPQSANAVKDQPAKIPENSAKPKEK